MRIILNGQEVNLSENTSLTTLLSFEELDPKLVVVELNEKILPEQEFESTILKSDDKLEIMQFVGGG